MFNIILTGVLSFIVGGLFVGLGIMKGLHNVNKKFVEATGIDFIDYTHHLLDGTNPNVHVIAIKESDED